jgi:heme-degrading monooxygenase HmoA
MFVRFVRLQVRQGREAELVAYYRDRVLPALEATEGCLYAALLSPWQGADYQSLTLWRSPDDVRRYEERGPWHRLLRGLEPVISASTPWRLRPETDPLATADGERKEIPADAFQVELGDAERAITEEGRVFVRVVSLRVAPDRHREFVERYRSTILPCVQSQEGCLGVLLADGAGEASGVVSISFWRREQDAVHYEQSGEFERLAAGVRDCFSPVYTWQLVLGEGADQRKQSLKVSGYQIVTGRRLDA